MNGGTSIIGENNVEAGIRGELAGADSVIEAAVPMLRHLLANDDQSLFGEEVIARVRGMFADIARQLVFALAEAGGEDDRDSFIPLYGDDIERALYQQPALLAHIHSLALEWQLDERLQLEQGVDPVLSPLVQSLIASEEPAIASAAMAFLVAQARFVQQQRRMELPLQELPGDLLHMGLVVMRKLSGDLPEEIISVAEDALRAPFDEASTRLALMSRLVLGMGGGAIAALAVAHAGVAIYLTALSQSSSQDRVLTTLSVSQSQPMRHALALYKAGLKPTQVRDQLERTGRDMSLAPDFDGLSAESAAALLAAASFGRAV